MRLFIVTRLQQYCTTVDYFYLYVTYVLLINKSMNLNNKFELPSFTRSREGIKWYIGPRPT